MDLVLSAISAGTGDQGTQEQSESDQLRRMVRVSPMDLKPAFLYFHHPHEDPKPDADGRASKKQCGLLVDDQVCRWASLFRCWEVDMGKSDAATAAKLGAEAGTSFSVVDGELKIAAHSGPFATSKATVQFLRDSLEKGNPEYWGQIQKRLEEQKAVLAEARSLASKKKWKESSEKYDELLQSDLRIGDFWDDMLAESVKVKDKASREKDD